VYRPSFSVGGVFVSRVIYTTPVFVSSSSDDDDDDDAMPEDRDTPYGCTVSATNPRCNCIRTLLHNHYLRPGLHKLLFYVVHTAVGSVQLGDKGNGTG